jgi:hypothetical protein
MPLMLNNADQEQCITAAEAVDAIEFGYAMWERGDAIRRGAMFHVLPTLRPTEALMLFSCEGGLRAPGYYALRIQPQISRLPDASGRSQRMLYTYQPGYYGGLVLLFSTDTAELLAIMNDGYVQHLRVAATGALGARYMARKDSRVLGIIGAGGMARTFAMTVAAVRPIERILVWSPTRSHVEALVEQIGPKVDAQFVIAAGPEEICASADIVCCCTNSFRPVVEPGWIRPGTHLNSVLPVELLNVYPKIDAAGVLVRKPPLLLNGFQDADFRMTYEIMSWVGGTPEERARVPAGITQPVTYANARIVDCIDRETGETYADRRDPQEITYLANVSYGTLPGEGNSSAGPQGIQFATVGGRIYDRARGLGIGRELPREWFLETTYTYSPGPWREPSQPPPVSA